MEVTISRGRTGKESPTAITRIDLGFDRRWLVIETSKARLGCVGLEVRAHVFQLSECGHFNTHVFGAGGSSDFRQQLLRGPGRATEKALLSLHQQAMAQIDTIRAAALSHYGQPPAHLPPADATKPPGAA